MGRGIEIPDIGQEYGRPDTERLGLFAEMGYLVGKKYTPVLKCSDIRDLKKRQMFPGGSKLKTGLQDCYFDQEFKRLFIGEAYPRKRKNDDGKKGKKKETGPVRPFIPSQYPNPLYHPGDAYGYFSYSEGFSPKQKPRGKFERPKRGIYTNPGKVGGPGYNDICIAPYPEHFPDKYDPIVKAKKETKSKKMPFRAGQPSDYFDPNPFLVTDPLPPYSKTKEVYTGKIGPTFKPPSPTKWDGGCKEGAFDKFPEYIEDRYNDPHRIDKLLQKIKDKKKPQQTKQKRINPPFKPPACCRTLQFPSVMTRNAEINTNSGNWTEMKPITFSQKFLIV